MKYVLPLAFCVAASLAASPASAEEHASVLSLTVDHGAPVALDRASSSIFVANPDIADVQVMSPTRVMVFGKRTGETTFVATDNNGKTLAERTIVVSQDLSQLRMELDSAIPGNGIRAASVPNGIVLTGTVRDPIAAADANKIAQRYMPSGGDIINRIEVVGSNQVMIRVRFAEVQRSINNSLGFDWQNALSPTSVLVGLATGNVVSAQGSGYFNSGSANNTGLFPRPNNTALNLPNDVLGFKTQITSKLSINGMIDALAQDGLLTILAEPNLTAMSGETANFLAGGQFPIPIPQQNGSISIQFQPYGISLAFTPTILHGDRISLHVRPEVSELTTNGSIVLDNISIPALTTRKAETTVEVGSGESFAIAGLIDNDQTQNVNEFPLLGDMPILGALFRSNSFQSGQTELVVIITPYVVKPSKEQLALPTDGFATPTEKERLLDLRYSNSDPNARPYSGDPVAVPAAPAAAPVAPVTTGYSPFGPPTPPPKVPGSMPAAIMPSSSSPQSPVLLHTSGDKDSGGLMVE